MKYWNTITRIQLKNLFENENNFYVKTVKNDQNKEKSEQKISNIIMAFDIETTSYFIDEEDKPLIFTDDKGIKRPFNYALSKEFYQKYKKQGMMYIWMMGIEGLGVYYGRTWKEFMSFIELIYISSPEIKKYIYVHNFSFEFQFIHNLFTFEVFAREPRKVMKANDNNFNIEFRCSLYLTNKRLEKVAEDFNLKCRKQSGKLDYNIIRTPLTKLTKQELLYCEYDILVMLEFLSIYKENYTTIENIPLTQTGEVRRDITRLFFKDKKHHDNINNMIPKTLKQYEEFYKLYMGGYTHSNYVHTNKLLQKVYSFDIKSSYPAVCCTEEFPMEEFKEFDINDFHIYREDNHIKTTIDDKKYCYYVDISMKGLKRKGPNTFLSLSKAKVVEGVKVDNGRVAEANFCRYLLCDVDFITLLNNYTCTEFKINKVMYAKKDYLPKKLVLYILNKFKEKTIYDGIEEKKSVYKEAKEKVNAIYGMFGTKILTDTITYNKHDKEIFKTVEITEQEAEERIDKMIERNSQNLSYPWGVWVAAYARRNLWSMIERIDKDVVYCDTDSVKFLGENNLKKFELYNKNFDKKILEVCLHYDLDPALFKPEKPKKEGELKGKIANLGYFEQEKTYEYFKTLGAKRYCYKHFDEDCKKESEKGIHITISGISKKAASAIKDIDKDFTIDKEFTYEETEKLIAYYNDHQEKVEFPDGWLEKSKSGICLQPTTYKLGIADEYLEIISK